MPELLRGVQSGKRYTITLRGEAVADLVPPQGAKRPDVGDAAENMRVFMRSRTPMPGLDLKALTGEGRA